MPCGIYMTFGSLIYVQESIVSGAGRGTDFYLGYSDWA